MAKDRKRPRQIDQKSQSDVFCFKIAKAKELIKNGSLVGVKGKVYGVATEDAKKGDRFVFQIYGRALFSTQVQRDLTIFRKKIKILLKKDLET